jgi:hypothetical protein
MPIEIKQGLTPTANAGEMVAAWAKAGVVMGTNHQSGRVLLQNKLAKRSPDNVGLCPLREFS